MKNLKDSPKKDSLGNSKSPEQLKEILRLEYERAELFNAEVQAFTKEAGIPANNELRYAGYHLLSSTADGVDEKYELIRSINHCKRASYEAGEAGVLIAYDLIGIFKEEFNGVQISSVIPNWVKIQEECDACMDALVASREKGDDRFQDYEVHKESFGILKAHHRTLEYSRDDLTVLKTGKINSENKHETIILLTKLGISVTILSIVVAVVIAN
jgi:hypothetical protein